MAMFSVMPENNQDGAQAPRRGQPTRLGTPQPQGLFSAGNAFGQAAGDAYTNTADYLKNNPMNYNNAPKLPGVDDFSADRQRIEQALMGRAKGELDTRYASESDAFEQKMANEGVDIGSERYKKEKALFEKGRNEAYNDANFRAMLAGGDEQSRLFGMGMQARQQSVSETDALRNSRLNEMAALINPAMEMEGLINQRDIASMQDATQRYGVDKNFESAGLDRTSREGIAKLQDETNRYGIDTGANTANLDRASRDAIARMNDATSRYGIDQGTLNSTLDRDQRQKLQDDDQKFRKGENKEDRKVQREGIKKTGGGGGGGGMNMNDILAIVEKLTGEKLSG